jgi:hypothetical protein
MLLEKNTNILSLKREFSMDFTLELFLQTKSVTGEVTNYELCWHTSAAMCRCCHAHFTLQFVYNILSCCSIVLTCFASVLGYIQCSMATFPVTFRMLWCIFAGFYCHLCCDYFLKAFFSGASLVVHKHSGGLAEAIAAQVERYDIVQKCEQN